MPNPPRILVVEDEAIVSADLSDRLEELGYQVVGTLQSAHNIQDKITDTAADLVLMDIQLHGHLDGIEAAQLIRDSIDVPVVFVTAHTDAATVERARATAPFGFVPKPISEPQLRIAIEISLERHRVESQLKRMDLWLRGILMSIADPLVVTDRWCLVQLANPAAVKLSGLSASGPGKRLVEFLPLVNTSNEQELQLPSETLVRDGEPERGSALLNEQPIEYSASPVRDDKGRVASIVWIFRRL